MLAVVKGYQDFFRVPDLCLGKWLGRAVDREKPRHSVRPVTLCCTAWRTNAAGPARV